MAGEKQRFFVGQIGHEKTKQYIYIYLLRNCDTLR